MAALEESMEVANIAIKLHASESAVLKLRTKGNISTSDPQDAKMTPFETNGSKLDDQLEQRAQII